MQIDDMVLISVDNHVVEPPSLGDFFREHLPAKFKDRAPQVIRRADGTDAWSIDGQEVATFGLNAVRGRPPENWGSDPSSFDQLRHGCYDVHERIRFDPFEHRPRSECTVGALRAQATDADATPREYGAADHTHTLAAGANQFLGAQDINRVAGE